jgi:hypothetical protein
MVDVWATMKFPSALITPVLFYFTHVDFLHRGERFPARPEWLHNLASRVAEGGRRVGGDMGRGVGGREPRLVFRLEVLLLTGGQAVGGGRRQDEFLL